METQKTLTDHGDSFNGSGDVGVAPMTLELNALGEQVCFSHDAAFARFREAIVAAITEGNLLNQLRVMAQGLGLDWHQWQALCDFGPTVAESYANLATEFGGKEDAEIDALLQAWWPMMLRTIAGGEHAPLEVAYAERLQQVRRFFEEEDVPVDCDEDVCRRAVVWMSEDLNRTA